MSEDVRLVCIQQLGLWMRTYPSYWVADGFIKYLGWTLNDKSSDVRYASLDAIVQLLAPADPTIIRRTKAFCDRFKERFAQMTTDIDPDVATKAIEYMRIMLKQESLGEAEGDFAPLLWDEHQQIREQAALFVFEDTFEDDLPDENHQEELVQLMNIFDKSCPLIENIDRVSGETQRQYRIKDDKYLAGFSRTLHQPMDTLVNLFWDHLPALRDYDAITKLMLKLSKLNPVEKGVGGRKQTAPVDEDRQLILCHLLNSVSKRATGTMEDPLVPNLSNTKKKAEREAIIAEGQTFSSHFLPLSTQLLTLYELDPTKLIVLLPVITRIDLTLFGVLRKHTEFTSLLKRLKSIYLKHSDNGVLEEATKALAVLVETEHQFKDEALSCATEIATELTQDWHAAYERVHGSQLDMEMSSDERLQAMHTALKRMVCLQRSLRLPQLQWESLPDVEKSFNYYALNHSDPKEQEILVLLMHFGFTTIFWNYSILQQEAKELAAEADQESAHEDEVEDAEPMDVDDEAKEDEDEEETDKRKKKKSTSSKKKKSARSGSAARSSSEPKQLSQKLLESTNRLKMSFLSQLELAMQSTDVTAFTVKDTAFRILSDAFVLLSGKLSHTSLGALVIGADKLRSLQTEYNQYFSTLIDATDVRHRLKGVTATEKYRQAFIADQRVFAFKEAIKVALYDMNSLQSEDGLKTTIRHRELAGLILARFGSVSKPNANN